MQSLEKAAYKQVWRGASSRSSFELVRCPEFAQTVRNNSPKQLQGGGESGGGGCGLLAEGALFAVSLRSISASTERAKLRFCNACIVPVRLLWIDYEGAERPYTILAPGESKTYQTFPSHVWAGRSLHDETLQLCNGSEAVAVPTSACKHPLHVVITPPPADTDAGFAATNFRTLPQPSKDGMRALLACHTRMQRSSASSSHEQPATLGDVPADLLLSIIRLGSQELAAPQPLVWPELESFCALLTPRQAAAAEP